jgi:hypothetical protein
MEFWQRLMDLGRAVRCALAFGTASKQIGLPLRAGLHTGEIEIRGRDIGGIAARRRSRDGPVSGQRSSCFQELPPTSWTAHV